ncbi:VacJ family lipoprotein [Candidatus Pelagibacter sp.]|nr:VacJ family lipoprotein [Candidatus Pelagibacter sp.]
MKKIFIIFIFSLLLALNVQAGTDGDNTLGKKNSKTTKDCFEGVNRGVFAFNNALDTIIFEPLAKGYSRLPKPIRTGTGNAMNNLSNLVTVPNNIFQGNIGDAGNNSLRFLINTTIGILGIFDPATSLGLNKRDKEDYGQTFGKWGFGPGCYIVLPILGPSTLRDASGSLVSLFGGDPWYNVTVRNDTHHFADFDYYASRVTTGVDFRAKNLDAIDNLEKNSMDFYASVKSLYLQDRKRKIFNSNENTDTMDDGDWEEIEDK